MRITEDKQREGTFADLRGILSCYAKLPNDEQLHQWIDEARSRALQSDPIGSWPLEAQMFDYIKKRVLKEHMKLVAQNEKALAYLSAFLPEHIGERFSQIISDVQRTWQPGTKLNDEQFTALYDINSQLRRTYDLSSARLPGMNSFDEEFKPLLGWEDYYSRYL